MIEIPGFRGISRPNYPLAASTTWRIGGPAELFAVPADLDDLLCILGYVKDHALPLFVLGRGSNILIDDAGLPGVTLQLGPAFRSIDREGDKLKLMADVPMPTLAKHACELGYAGFEFLIGIPGTVGAGVVINAGKGFESGSDMRSILHEVTFLDADLNQVKVNANNLELGYRSSRLKGTRAIIIETVFDLRTPGECQAVRRKQSAILKERREKFPLKYPNAGSVFKRPVNHPPAGQLIESVGLKGLRIGDAQISTLHANFIVNLGRATSADIKALMEIARERVVRAHGVVLEPEVIFFPEQRNW
jgi:UDP-N-acetylmuramate dehydrogenase